MPRAAALDVPMRAGPGARPSILIVTLSLDIGGTENHLGLIAPELKRRGFDIGIYCFNRLGAEADGVCAAGVEVIGPVMQADGRSTSRAGRVLLSAMAAAKLTALLARRRPRIAHFFLPEAYLFGAPAAILAGTPIRLMSRRGINQYQAKMRGVRQAEEMLHPRMTAVLGNSRRVVADLLAEGCARDRIGLIYSGTDLSLYDRPVDRAAIRERLGVAPGELMAVKLASLFPYKGHADLIQALALAMPRLAQPVVLVLAGRDDGIEAELATKAKRLGVGDRVRFLGLRRDVPDLLKAADIGLLTSHEEGFSNAIIECMAAGLPMIVTEVGGNAEAVADGHNGLVVPPRAPVQLAEALVRMAADETMRVRFGAESRRQVQKRFTLAACADAYEALYIGLDQGLLPTDIVGVGIDT